MKKVKEEKHLTIADIAVLSNIPTATVTRVFNGATPNPTFETISAIGMALGMSLDEIAGIRSADEEPIPSRVEMTLNSYADLLAEKDLRIMEKNEAIANLHKEKTRILFCFLFFVVFVFLLFAIDIFNGHWGYLRY